MNRAAQPSKWLTLPEAAEHIRATDTRLLRNAIKAGDLPAYVYGRRDIRIDIDDLNAWMKTKPC